MDKQFKIQSIESRTQESIKNVEEFLTLAEDLKQLLAHEGIQIKIAKDSRPVLFESLPVDTQKSQLSHFGTYVGVCAEANNEGYSLKDSPVLVWKMLKRMGLKPNHDVMDKIKDHHIVEFYNTNNVQTFRNLNFFSICSYTLDELLSVPWWKLYHREDEINREIFKHASSVLTGDRKDTFKPDVPSHFLKEINSELGFQMKVDIDYMSPLYVGDIVDHIFVIEQAQLMDN